MFFTLYNNYSILESHRSIKSAKNLANFESYLDSFFISNILTGFLVVL